MGGTAHTGEQQPMRKRRVPIGCSQRNSRHYRFPVPNSVWGHQLKPIEFVILSYLCYHQSHSSNHDPLPAGAIARTIHVTVSTVEKYLSTLVCKGLVADGHSLTSAFQNTHSKKFFTLPNEIFLLNLPPSAFVVYAYLLLIENRQTHTCHPSYNTIAVKTGISKNTAINSISVLLDKKLIAMEHSRYYDQRGMKWKGNNLYTLLPISQILKEYEDGLLAELKLAESQHKWAQRVKPSEPVARCC